MKMFVFLIPFSLVLFFGCSSAEKLMELNANCCNEFATSFDEGILLADSLDKTILTIILSEDDSKYLDARTCDVFNFREKEYKLNLERICDDFTLVKLKSASFRDQFHDSLFYYQGAIDFVDEAFLRDSSFIFISSPLSPTVYGPTYLNDKEGVEDLIYIKFGP